MDFLHVNAALYLQTPNMLLSEVAAPLNDCINDEYRERKTGAWLKFSLDDKAIHAIQSHRNGEDIRLRIQLIFTFIRKDSTSLIEGEHIWGLEGVGHGRGDIHFAIPKSIWVEKILPDLGFPGFKLIEIPLTHKRLDEAYDNIIMEFTNASEYFTRQDFNKAVGHCRHTLDDLTRNLKKLKDGVESETTFKWLSTVDEATFTWIDALNKSISAISSKPHHAGLKKDFSRKEAESIYLVTLGLLNLVGQYAKLNKPQDVE